MFISSDHLFLQGYNATILAYGQTGTGKTLAFLLPIFENISLDINATQALIVSPTRELALQTFAVVKQVRVIMLIYISYILFFSLQSLLGSDVLV